MVRLDGLTVVDTRTGDRTPDRSVLIDQGRIVAVQATADAATESADQVIDARGRFAVPGYNDMHVHALGPADPSGTLALLLANGVTGIRQMSGSPELLAQRRDGTLPISPDGPELLAMPGSVLLPFNAASPDAAVAEIRRQQRDGADFIKIVAVPRDVFFPAVAAAGTARLPAVGHLQNGLDAAEASRAGFRCVEHLGPGDSLWISCSEEEAALRADSGATPGPKLPSARLPFADRLMTAMMRRILVNPAARTGTAAAGRLDRAFATFSAAKAGELAARYRADGSWQCPTLMRLKTQERPGSPGFAADPNLRYLPPRQVRLWRQVTKTFNRQPAAVRATLDRAYDRQLELTRLFDEAGVPMLAGTDDGGWEIPGFVLHQEFDELAAAGLSPLRVLQLTTLRAAEFLGRTATMGTVEAGKNADLVLLDADPVENVASLHRISGVVRAGRYHARADLDRLLARVEAGGGYLR